MKTSDLFLMYRYGRNIHIQASDKASVLLAGLSSAPGAIVDLVEARIHAEGNTAQSARHPQNQSPSKCNLSGLLVDHCGHWRAAVAAGDGRGMIAIVRIV